VAPIATLRKQSELSDSSRPVGANGRLKIIYIAGYGRSGTTLLSIALGEHPSVFGAGEIHELTRSAWAQNNYCACGAPLRECEFWSVAVDRWLSAAPANFMEEYRRLQWPIENSFRPAFLKRGKAHAAFAKGTLALFREIAAASGKSIIVDSSKLPGRAEALARISGLDVYVVHLVRDGRGVAWSLKKAYARDAKAGLQRELRPKSTIRTSMRWSLVNMAAESLARAVGPDRYIRVRYEDFSTDPACVLNRIGNLVGKDFSGVGARLGDGGSMSARHQLAGSRLRMTQSIKVEKDEQWSEHMPAASRRLFTAFSWVMLRRFGYLAGRR
jgi:hypothetical protein